MSKVHYYSFAFYLMFNHSYTHRLSSVSTIYVYLRVPNLMMKFKRSLTKGFSLSILGQGCIYKTILVSTWTIGQRQILYINIIICIFYGRTFFQINCDYYLLSFINSKNDHTIFFHLLHEFNKKNTFTGPPN